MEKESFWKINNYLITSIINELFVRVGHSYEWFQLFLFYFCGEWILVSKSGLALQLKPRWLNNLISQSQSNILDVQLDVATQSVVVQSLIAVRCSLFAVRRSRICWAVWLQVISSFRPLFDVCVGRRYGVFIADNIMSPTVYSTSNWTSLRAPLLFRYNDFFTLFFPNGAVERAWWVRDWAGRR